MTSRSARMMVVAVLIAATGAIDLAAQKPVVTLTSSATRIAESLVLNRTTSPTLATTTTRTGTTTTSRLPTTSTAPVTNSATLTITRTGPNSLSDLTVRYSVRGTALSGKDYSALGGTITIPRGASTATITLVAIDDPEDELDETIIVDLIATATSPYVLTDPASANITIIDDDDVRLINLDIANDTMLAGGSVDVRITLSGAAPPGGITAPLTTSGGSAAALPTIVVAAGTRVGQGTITTAAITSSVSIIVQGSIGGSVRSDTLVLYPAPRVQTFALNRSAQFGGRSVSGTVTLASPAPPIGATVELQARVALMMAGRTTVGTTTTTVNAGSLVSGVPMTLPAGISIPPGASTASVSLPTDAVSSPVTAVITALVGSSSSRDTVTIHPFPKIAMAEITPGTVEGGETVTSTIKLETPLPAGLSWNPSLTTSDPALVLPPQRMATFRSGADEWTATLNTRAVANLERACIGVGGSPTNQSGGCVNLQPPAVTEFAINDVAEFGGRSISGRLTTTRPVTTRPYYVRLDVQVLSPAGATSPLSANRIQLPTGESTLNWSIGTTAVVEPTMLRIATLSGQADTVTIHPFPKIGMAEITPGTVEGGETVTSTIKLETPMPAGLSWNPSLTTSDPALVLPPQRMATFRSGADEWTATLNTRAVANLERACIGVGGSPTNQSGGCVNLRPPAVTEFDITRVAEFGGRSISGRITTTRPVTTRPYYVRLDVQVLSPAGATSPLSANRIQLPTGESTMIWSIGTTAVVEPTMLRIATLSGQADTVTIHPFPKIAMAEITPGTVEGGETVTSTIKLETPLPAGLNWNPSLTTSDPALVLPPTRMATFRSGADEWTATLNTRAVANLETACLRVGGSPTNQSGGCVNLRPPAVTAFEISDVAEFGGRDVSGRITTTRPVTTRPYYINLNVQVLSPAGATSPLSTNRIQLPTGENTLNWSIATAQVTEPTTVRITTANGLDDTITIHPLPSLQSVTVDPGSVTGGDPIDVTVRLQQPVPTGLNWDVSLNGSGGVVTAGGIARIGSGATEWKGQIATAVVQQQTTAQIMARSGGSTRSASVTLLPAPPPVPSALTFQPSTVTGGQPVTATITLDHVAPAGGTQVDLGALTNRVQVPPSVVVPAGAGQATFTIATSTVASTEVAIITATANGASKSATLRLDPPAPTLVSLQITPPTVAGGGQSTGTVTLSRGVAGGVRVDLTSQDPGAASVPTFVLVQAGVTTANFTIQTTAVAQTRTVGIEARIGTDVLSENLVVQQPPALPSLSAVQITPAGTVIGGAEIDMTVVLDRNAPAGGVLVQLGSSNPAVIDPPASLNIPAGQRSATLTIRTAAVASNTSVPLNARLNGNITLRPVDLEPQPINRVQVPNSVGGGSTAQAFVRLSRPAPAGGLVVALASSDPRAAAVPPSVTVPAGATQASFQVQTFAVRQNTEVSLTAGLGQGRTTLTVRAR